MTRRKSLEQALEALGACNHRRKFRGVSPAQVWRSFARGGRFAGHGYARWLVRRLLTREISDDVISSTALDCLRGMIGTMDDATIARHFSDLFCCFLVEHNVAFGQQPPREWRLRERGFKLKFAEPRRRELAARNAAKGKAKARAALLRHAQATLALLNSHNS